MTFALGLRRTGILLPVGLLAAVGCSAAVTDHAAGSNVHGTVQLKNQPVPDVIVTAHDASGAKVASGQTDEIGLFRLVGASGNEPAILPDGEYRLTVSSLTGVLDVPPAWISPEQTPFRGMVSGGHGQWEIDLGMGHRGGKSD